jgi:hypothetical protein
VERGTRDGALRSAMPNLSARFRSGTHSDGTGRGGDVAEGGGAHHHGCLRSGDSERLCRYIPLALKQSGLDAGRGRTVGVGGSSDLDDG